MLRTASLLNVCPTRLSMRLSLLWALLSRSRRSAKHELGVSFRQNHLIGALRVLGVVAFCLLAITAPPPRLPMMNALLETAGIVAVFSAIAGRAWCFLYTGGRKDGELVTGGPYSITRNPLYFFSLVGIAGVAVQTGSLLSSTAIATASFVTFNIAIRGEEGDLARRFGERFLEYQQTTPRLLPDLTSWKELEDIPLRSVRALASLRGGVLFLMVWAGVDLIQFAHSVSLLPAFWTLPI